MDQKSNITSAVLDVKPLAFTWYLVHTPVCANSPTSKYIATRGELRKYWHGNICYLRGRSLCRRAVIVGLRLCPQCCLQGNCKHLNGLHRPINTYDRWLSVTLVSRVGVVITITLLSSKRTLIQFSLRAFLFQDTLARTSRNCSP